MTLVSYKELKVWQKSFSLAIEVFQLTKNFPKSELYGIISQMRRAAFAIPSNIAEGYTRGHRAEYLQFLMISFSSGAELETQVLLAKALELASAEKFLLTEGLLNEVMKMLNGLITSLK